VCMVDLLALQSAIDDDKEAVGGGVDAATRAVAATTAILALTINDMITGMMGGMSGSHVYGGVLSTRRTSVTSQRVLGLL
jgi:hypothetical protein